MILNCRYIFKYNVIGCFFMNFNNNNIAIDGYAATGKSTLALALSLDLKMKFLNTGKMYRLVAIFNLRNNYTEEELEKNLKKLNFTYNKIKICSRLFNKNTKKNFEKRRIYC